MRLHTYLISSIILVSGCSSINTLVDPNAATMEEIYEAETNNQLTDPVIQLRMEHQVHAGNRSNPYSFDQHFLSAQTQADNLFEKLPNPILYMYVKPHPAGESGSPIPGYVTKFYLYTRDHFAQPGEIIQSPPKPGL